MLYVAGEENMTLAELALFHIEHEFSFCNGLLVVGGKDVKEPFSIDTSDARKVISEIYNHKQRVLNALLDAKHRLETLNGLTVADGAAPEDTFILDETELLALVDKALHSLEDDK